MKIWFCETCGKRLTDADLSKDRAHDKQAKGMFCSACAVGVNTMTFDAIEAPVAAPAAPPIPKTASHTHIKTDRITATDLARSRAAAKTHGKPSLQPQMIIGGSVAVVLVVLGLLLTRSKPHVEKEKEKIAATDSGSKTPAPATTQSVAVPAEVISAPAAAAPASKLPEDPERKAEDAFEVAKKAVAALPADDKIGRAAILEAYLKEHGDAIVASRASVMLKQLREPAPAPTPAASATPTVTEDAKPKGDLPVLFNGKDLSNWTIRSKTPDECKVEDGAIVMSPTFNGSLDTALKLNDNFVLEVEFFCGDAGAGYLEFHTGAGTVIVDRRSSNNWVKLQITAKDGKVTPTVISGKAEPVVDPGRFENTLRIFTFAGIKKTIRVLRLIDGK